MGEDRVAGVERQPQVLAAPVHVEDLPPGQYRGEVHRAGQVPADRAGVVHLDGRDGAAGDPAGEAGPDGLDFGQLRHQMVYVQTVIM